MEQPGREPKLHLHAARSHELFTRIDDVESR